MTKQNVYLNHILPFSNKQPMICPYCQKTAYFDKGLWRCNPCNALAKANKETKQPIGKSTTMERPKNNSQKFWCFHAISY